MLMNHKNFHLTQISDKSNDIIFLKSPKTMFFGPVLTIFGHFCLVEISSKKSSSVTHNYIWALKTMLRFRKKLMSQSQENLWTDERTDGQTLFYRNLPAEAGVQ